MFKEDNLKVSTGYLKPKLKGRYVHLTFNSKTSSPSWINSCSKEPPIKTLAKLGN